MDNIISKYSSDYIYIKQDYKAPEVIINPFLEIITLYDQVTNGDRYSITDLVEKGLEVVSSHKLEDITELLNYYRDKYNIENLTYDNKVKFYTISIYSSLPEIEYRFENINQLEKLIGKMTFWVTPYKYKGRIIDYCDNVIYEHAFFRILNDIEVDKLELEKYNKLKHIPMPYVSSNFLYGGNKVIAYEYIEPIKDIKNLNMWIMISDISDILKKLNKICVIENLTPDSISINENKKYDYDFIINNYNYVSFEKERGGYKGNYKNIYCKRKNISFISNKDQIMNLLNVVENIFKVEEDDKFKKFKLKIKDYKKNDIHKYTINEAFKNCVI